MSSQHDTLDTPLPRKGFRLTPRTCLWPLAGSLVLTFGLSIGLTFRSAHHCYAGTCGEWLFPRQARLHVAVWYAWIAATVAALGLRAFHPSLRAVLARPLGRLPRRAGGGRVLTLSGAAMVAWVAALYGAVVGIWWVRLHDYFVERGAAGGVERGGGRLAAIALTGHLCDVSNIAEGRR